MASAPTSYMPTVAAVDTRTKDQLSFAFTARPQAMTFYVRFVEGGTVTMAANTKVIHVGASGATNPFLAIETSGSFYRVRRTNGLGTAVTSTLAAAPSVGQLVELRAVLNADGSVQIGQSIAGAAETTGAASSALALDQAWSGQLLWVNSVGTASVGIIAVRNIETMAGARTLQEMRVRAGVES